MQPYAMDLRTRVRADGDAGMRTAAVAQTYTVRTAWVRRLLPPRRQTGESQPRKGRPGPHPLLAPHEDRLPEVVHAQPDLSAAEYRDRLGVACAVLTV